MPRERAFDRVELVTYAEADERRAIHRWLQRSGRDGLAELDEHGCRHLLEARPGVHQGRITWKERRASGLLPMVGTTRARSRNLLEPLS